MECPKCGYKCVEVDMDFESFWQAWPKKKSKGDARKAWKQTKAIRPALDVIVAKVGLLKGTRNWLKDGGQFIPYPASWLRAEGWDDEVTVETKDTIDPESARKRKEMLR